MTNCGSTSSDRLEILTHSKIWGLRLLSLRVRKSKELISGLSIPEGMLSFAHILFLWKKKSIHVLFICMETAVTELKGKL